jgi:hypothetical protein
MLLLALLFILVNSYDASLGITVKVMLLFLLFQNLLSSHIFYCRLLTFYQVVVRLKGITVLLELVRWSTVDSSPDADAAGRRLFRGAANGHLSAGNKSLCLLLSVVCL